MGLILDTSILIAGERRRHTVKELFERVLAVHGDQESAVSAISVIEFTHGIYRARTEQERERRQAFADELFEDTVVHSITPEIAKLAGRIEGQEAAHGNIIALQDLLIGATALHLGFAVVTHNVRHFERIPGLPVLTI